METRTMVYNMCHNVLNGTDMRAICKARGLPKKASNSPSLLESFFLSDAGVKTALLGLTREEVLALHLLNFAKETVDITFFNRIYASETKRDSFYYTFTQRHQEVLKKVRRNLVRKGVLLMMEVASGGQTKMERWRFAFPSEFGPFLPSLFPSTALHSLEGAGEINQRMVRNKIRKVLRVTPDGEKQKKTVNELHLVAGELHVGEKVFSMTHLERWRRNGWQQAFPPLAGSRQSLKKVKPGGFMAYALAQLPPNNWSTPDELAPLLKIFYDDKTPPKARDICEAGWKWECLVKQEVDGQAYYRLLKEQPALETLPPERYLELDSEKIKLNLKLIPYEHLNYMNRIAELSILKGRLIATPRLRQVGSHLHQIRHHALTTWLRNEMAAFDALIETAEARWGKQIIHQNLLVAQVKDFSLKIRLEHAFADSSQMLFLADEWIAFPRDVLPQVEQVVKKAGNFIKTVQTNG